ncbi:hypothetical protein F862_gp026 [Vibrio phage vB_VpaS_MAR10]|uniref:Uncharacterized protein n=1 Tax=Vibrio phage vB_VpaS_MAR10 TaxID=1229755 RepID=K7R9C6_9CAUD|nr:hypothetical protein F862_gp026 [Vibrio phage vB_VpaS_MAR10]AFV81258.1 hypothetical protein MAR10_026 [Vibrio phage vB_VpaS_MAR10]
MRTNREETKESLLWSMDEILLAPNRVVPALLTSAYLYYLRSDMQPIMRDEDFDQCCRLLRRKYREIDHPHKRLIKMSDLSAGTLFRLREHDYPTIVKVVAVEMSLGTLYDKPMPTPRPKPEKRVRKRRVRNNGGSSSGPKGFLNRRRK